MPIEIPRISRIRQQSLPLGRYQSATYSKTFIYLIYSGATLTANLSSKSRGKGTFSGDLSNGPMSALNSLAGAFLNPSADSHCCRSVDCLSPPSPAPGVATKNTAMMSSLIVRSRDSKTNLFDCGTGRCGKTTPQPRAAVDALFKIR